jgi:hypothetical protein
MRMGTRITTHSTQSTIDSPSGKGKAGCEVEMPVRKGKDERTEALPQSE